MRRRQQQQLLELCASVIIYRARDEHGMLQQSQPSDVAVRAHRPPRQLTTQRDMRRLLLRHAQQLSGGARQHCLHGGLLLDGEPSEQELQ